MSIIKRLASMIIHIIIKEEIKVGVSKSEKEMVEGLIVDYIWNKYKYKCTKREIRGVSWYILDINGYKVYSGMEEGFRTKEMVV